MHPRSCDASLANDAQMVRAGRVAHRQREAATCPLAGRERGDDLQPNGIGQRLEHLRELELVGVRHRQVGLAGHSKIVEIDGAAAEGRGLRLWWLGTLGFAGFNLLGFTGLEHARAQSAALITALAPLLTALVLWQRSGVRPRRATLVALVVALAGVALVIGRGDAASILHGSIGWGDALVLGGVLSFILYTLGAARFPELSPLRFTALTASLGWLSIAAATVVVSATGLEPEPSSTRTRTSAGRSSTSRSSARSARS